MNPWETAARWLIGLGLMLLFIGAAFYLLAKFVPGGRLPGDLVFKRDGLSIYFPLGTCIVLSLLLTLVLNFLFRR